MAVDAYSRVRAHAKGVGQLRRQCTKHWKIVPMQKWLREHREGRQVELWLGITLDEVQRMKPSRVGYITHRWPYLEPNHWGGRRLYRWDVERLLRELLGDDAVPPRSACYFCPYRSLSEWRRLRDEGNGDWERVLAFDEAVRHKRPPYDLFLNRDCVPMRELSLDTGEGQKQLALWEEECEGVCGL